MPLASRTRIVRIAGVALAVLLLVVVPGFLAMRPGFFGRYPALAAQYDPWTTSSHAEVGCEQCHVAPGVLARAAYRVRTVGEFYVGLVSRSRTPELFPAPTNDACLACHTDLRTVSPKGDLQIPHRAHVSVLKMACVECHDHLVHELSPEGKNTPTMAGCLRCHNGDAAKDGCTTCHTEKAAPPSHMTADWLVVHAEQADDPECVTCHKWKEDWCVDCHRDRPRTHGPDWRAVHGERVKAHRSCEACHVGAFCVRCHGLVPQENFDPTLTLVE
jgi:hypothetical protein